MPEIHFEDSKKKSPSHLRFTMQELPIPPKQRDEENEEENVGTEAAESAAHSLRQVGSSHQMQKRHSSRTEPATGTSAPKQQKQTIKRKYAAAKQEQDRETVKRTGEAAASAARRAVEKAKKAAAWIREHKKGFALILAGLMLAAFLLNMVSSCGIMMEGVISGIAAGSYPVPDEIILAAENSYLQREEDLRQMLDSYERNHSYHAYTYALDPIEHDPYILMAILCALHPDAWTLDQVEDTMEMLFEKHYILTRRVETQIRWRNIETGEDCEANDPLGEPYPYYICHLSLENFDLSHVPIHIMGHAELSRFATFKATLGNRPNLFPDSIYVSKYVYGGYTKHKIPEAYLEDEDFAEMIKVAEKYLGYPYVWGGSTPSTSFDCSGYVSWVLNHSGWNLGRRYAQGLYDLCTPVSQSNVAPGDLVFFKGTYDTPYVSHVGIYVGDNWMLHCGDPISYTKLNTTYWQTHFYAYGRLPEKERENT